MLLFQPGEENAGGADIVMNDDCFKKFDIGCIFGLHVQPEVEEGRIGVKSGPFMAQTIEFNIEIEGKSSHGAQPHKGIDSIVVACQLVNGYQSIISRNTSPLQPAVLTIGKIAGGQVRNIIAEVTRLEGTLRTFDINTYRDIRNRMEEINDGLEKMYNVNVKTDFIDFCPPVVNDNNLYEKFVGLLSEDEFVKMEPMTISEDFGFYQMKLPGLYFMLGSKNDANGYTYPLHNSKFDFDEKILCKGVDIFTRIIENL